MYSVHNRGVKKGQLVCTTHPHTVPGGLPMADKVCTTVCFLLSANNPTCFEIAIPITGPLFLLSLLNQSQGRCRAAAVVSRDHCYQALINTQRTQGSLGHCADSSQRECYWRQCLCALVQWKNKTRLIRSGEWVVPRSAGNNTKRETWSIVQCVKI